jgi:tetratricopeptide (TPR) repeat protein
MKAVYLEVAFDGQPHVFSSYRAGEVAIDIEHILPDGFDYKGHLGNPLRVEWDEAGLLADIYHSRGNLFFESRRFGDAVKLYQKALRLNLKHNQARLNMGLALAELGRTREAARLLQEPP